MNLQEAIELYGARPEPPPPLFIPQGELKMMELRDRTPPFGVGDTVIPRLIPIDCERGSKRSQQITTEEQLVVATTKSHVTHHKVTFEGMEGIYYDAAFFKKVQEQKKVLFKEVAA